MSGDVRVNRARRVAVIVWRQLPFFVWLIALWMLLWGQFTWLAFLTGLIAALVVTRIFRLPPVELSGRVNLWWGFVFVVEFVFAVVRGSLTVAWQVLDFRRQPGTAIIAVPLRTDDDLIMTHTAVTASLIPGSLIVETDRDRRILYLHIIGVRNDADVEKQRASVYHWEERIVRAVGSRAQLQTIREDAAARRRPPVAEQPKSPVAEQPKPPVVEQPKPPVVEQPKPPVVERAKRDETPGGTP